MEISECWSLLMLFVNLPWSCSKNDSLHQKKFIAPHKKKANGNVRFMHNAANEMFTSSRFEKTTLKKTKKKFLHNIQREHWLREQRCSGRSLTSFIIIMFLVLV